MKQIFTIGLLSTLALISCTEVPVAVDTTERGRDTTYIAEVEPSQPKKFLIEEPNKDKKEKVLGLFNHLIKEFKVLQRYNTIVPFLERNKGFQKVHHQLSLGFKY